MEDLPGVKRLEVVEIRPGDTVIVTLPSHATPETAKALMPHLKELFPENEVVFLGGDIALEVVRHV